jgi:hypothetical protein
MTDTFIDLTQRKPKRYVTGRCHYCDHNRYPSGKLIDPTTDKMAKQTAEGDWMCGVFVIEKFEEIKRLYEMNNRGKYD